MNRRSNLRRLAGLALALTLAFGGARAEAQMPIPSLNTPTLHGAQPVTGRVYSVEIGYPTLRNSLYFGMAPNRDVGIELSAPTFPGDLSGYFQRVGLDARAPFRFRLIEAAKVVGSLRVAPFFHVGQSGPNVGMGGTVGLLLDVPLPKIFKLIVGLDTRWGFEHFGENANAFGGSTLVNLGIESFFKSRFFFTMILNVGAQYASGRGGRGRGRGRGRGSDAVYHHLFGFGYKWQ